MVNTLVLPLLYNYHVYRSSIYMLSLTEAAGAADHQMRLHIFMLQFTG